ncbi:MAG: alpha/beta fold hydrolase [Anaerolineae bacterium]
MPGINIGLGPKRGQPLYNQPVVSVRRETPEEFKEGVLEHAGCSLHYWLGGREGAPLVVFTHGATIDHHEWDATLPLVGKHFRVLAWDMRGHGLSRPAVFGFEQAVDDLLALLNHLDAPQAVLAGHSLGGNLSQELVFRHPGRVKALACLDCTWNFQKLTWLDEFGLKLAEVIFKLYSYPTLVNQSLALTTASPEGQALLRPAVESLTQAEYIQIMLAGTACLHYEAGYAIGEPLLLMVGDQDLTGNIVKVMPKWAAVEPDCRLVVFPGARHAPNLDMPEQFHKELLEFLLNRCQ